jgi:protease I
MVSFMVLAQRKVLLRRSETVLDLVRAFDDAGKPIAFICHAGWVPISAKIIKGRRATSVGAIRDDMVNAGADWVDEATVVDGTLSPPAPRPIWAPG